MPEILPNQQPQINTSPSPIAPAPVKPRITVVPPAMPPPPTPPKKKLSGWLLGLILVALIIVVAVMFYNQYAAVPGSPSEIVVNHPVPHTQVQGNSQAVPSPTYATPAQVNPLPAQNVLDSQLPAGFPTNFPIEPKAVIISNTTQNFSNGNVNGSRIIQSPNPAGQEFTYYLNYFSKAGWQILSKSQVGLGGTSVFVAMDNGQQATVSIYQASASGPTEANISILTPKSH